MKALLYLNSYFLKYKWSMLFGILITIAAKIFSLFTPKLIGNLVDVISRFLSSDRSSLVQFKADLFLNISLLIGSALLAGLFTFFMRQTIINVSRYVEFDLKNEIYKQYQRLSLSFYKSNRTGDLMSRISEDVSKVRMYVGPAIMYTMNMVTLFIVAFINMYREAPSLTLYIIIPLPLLSLSIYYLSRQINIRSTEVQQHLSTLSAFTQEAFSGIAILKSFAIEPLSNREFQSLADTQREKQINLTKVQALFFPMMLLLIGFSNILVLYIGGKQYMDGTIKEFGTIVEFLVYVNMLTWPVATLGWVTSIVQEAEASQQRINDFLLIKPEIQNPSLEPFQIKGSIRFENVNFTYPDTNIKAINNLSFSIGVGETLAIIGKTGAGKSSILDLISRLYDPESGTIYIDEQDISKVNLNDLRRQIGYVTQEAFLFSDSIRNNIRFGRLEASDEEIIESAKIADLDDNITSFAKGYDTLLGERGVTLSGGQKQRMSIARSIVKNPVILLLDDCLSAVDTKTEERILKNLKPIIAKRTTIIVSHRISSIKNADHILVIENGSVVQSGKHKDLIGSPGYYQLIYQEQHS